MDFEKGNTIEEIIENSFCMFYFNLMTGDYTIEYCESQIIKHEKSEDYEICEGIKKAINFKKYGNSVV